jgi:hypothetical protein
MFTHPYIGSQLAREHQRQMLAEASQRQLRSRRRRPPVAKNPNAAARIIRRLAAAIAKAGVVAAEAPGAVWPAGPHQTGETAPESTRSMPRSLPASAGHDR